MTKEIVEILKELDGHLKQDFAHIFRSDDPYNKGQIRVSKFNQIVQRYLPSLPTSKLSAIGRHYEVTVSGAPFVNYLGLLADIKNIREATMAINNLYHQILEQMKRGKTSFYKAFLQADKDKSGKLSKEEMVALLQKENLSFRPNQILFAFDLLDNNNDGSISFNEFESGLKKLSQEKGLSYETLASSEPFNEKNVRNYWGIGFCRAILSHLQTNGFRDSFDFFEKEGVLNKASQTVSQYDFENSVSMISGVSNEELGRFCQEIDPKITTEISIPAFQKILVAVQNYLRDPHAQEAASPAHRPSPGLPPKNSPSSKSSLTTLWEKITQQVSEKHPLGVDDYLMTQGAYNGKIARGRLHMALNQAGCFLSREEEVILDQNCGEAEFFNIGSLLEYSRSKVRPLAYSGVVDQSLPGGALMNFKNKARSISRADAEALFAQIDAGRLGFLAFSQFQYLVERITPNQFSLLQIQELFGSLDKTKGQKVFKEDFLSTIWGPSEPPLNPMGQPAHQFEWAKPVFQSLASSLSASRTSLDSLFPYARDGKIDVYEFKSTLSRVGFYGTPDFNAVVTGCLDPFNSSLLDLAKFKEILLHFTQPPKPDHGGFSRPVASLPPQILDFVNKLKRSASTGSVDLQRTFAKMDFNHDLRIQEAEFVRFCKMLDEKLPVEGLVQLFDQIDLNRDKTLELKEFLEYFELPYKVSDFSLIKKMEWAARFFKEIGEKARMRSTEPREAFRIRGEEMEISQLRQGFRDFEINWDGETMNRLIKELLNGGQRISWKVFAILLQKYAPLIENQADSDFPAFSFGVDTSNYAGSNSMNQRPGPNGAQNNFQGRGNDNMPQGMANFNPRPADRGGQFGSNGNWGNNQPPYPPPVHFERRDQVPFGQKEAESISYLSDAIKASQQTLDSLIAGNQLGLNLDSLLQIIRYRLSIAADSKLESALRFYVSGSGGVIDLHRLNQDLNAKQLVSSALLAQFKTSDVVFVAVQVFGPRTSLDAFQFISVLKGILPRETNDSTIQCFFTQIPKISGHEVTRDEFSRVVFEAANPDPPENSHIQKSPVIQKIQGKITNPSLLASKLLSHDPSSTGFVLFSDVLHELSLIGLDLSYSESQELQKSLKNAQHGKTEISELFFLLNLPQPQKAPAAPPQKGPVAPPQSGAGAPLSGDPQAQLSKAREALKKKLIEHMKKLKINSTTMFRKIDQDCDQSISLEEFQRHVIQNLESFPKQKIPDLFKAINTSNSGKISLDEFKKFIVFPENSAEGKGINSEIHGALNKIKAKISLENIDLKGRFERIQGSESGIPFEKFLGLLNEFQTDVLPIEAELLFALFDADNNGTVSCSEFMSLVTEEANFSIDSNGVRLIIFQYLRKNPSENGAKDLFTKFATGAQMNQKQFREMLTAAGAANLKPNEYEYFFKKANTNSDWRLSQREFLDFYDESTVSDLLPGLRELRMKVSQQMERALQPLESAFRRFDKDGDGFLSKAEFQSMLFDLGIGNLTPAQTEDLFDYFDADNDYQVSLDEFMKQISGQVVDVFILISRIQIEMSARRIKGADELIRMYDKDGDSQLSFKEYCEWLADFKMKMTYFEKTELFNFLDKDKKEKLGNPNLEVLEERKEEVNFGFGLKELERMNPEYAQSFVKKHGSYYNKKNTMSMLEETNNSFEESIQRFGEPMENHESPNMRLRPSQQLAKAITIAIDLKEGPLGGSMQNPSASFSSFFQSHDRDGDSFWGFNDVKELGVELGFSFTNEQVLSILGDARKGRGGSMSRVNETPVITLQEAEIAFWLHSDPMGAMLIRSFEQGMRSRLASQNISIDQFLESFDYDRDKFLSKKELGDITRAIFNENNQQNINSIFEFMNISFSHEKLSFDDIKHCLLPQASPYKPADRPRPKSVSFGVFLLDDFQRETSRFMAQSHLKSIRDLFRRYESSPGSNSVSRSGLISFHSEVTKGLRKQDEDAFLSLFDPDFSGFVSESAFREKMEGTVTPELLLNQLRESLGRRSISEIAPGVLFLDSSALSDIICSVDRRITREEAFLLFDFFDFNKQGQIDMNQLSSVIEEAKLQPTSLGFGDAPSFAPEQDTFGGGDQFLGFGRRKPQKTILEELCECIIEVPDARNMIASLPVRQNYISFVHFSDFCTRNFPKFPQAKVKDLFNHYKNKDWIFQKALITDIDEGLRKIQSSGSVNSAQPPGRNLYSLKDQNPANDSRNAERQVGPDGQVDSFGSKLKREMDKVPKAKFSLQNIKKTNEYVSKKDLAAFCSEFSLSIPFQEIESASQQSKGWIYIRKLNEEISLMIPQSNKNLCNLIRQQMDQKACTEELSKLAQSGSLTSRELEPALFKVIPSFRDSMALARDYPLAYERDSIDIMNILGDLALQGLPIELLGTDDSAQRVLSVLSKTPNITQLIKGLPQQNSYVSFRDFSGLVSTQRLPLSEKDISELFLHFKNKSWISSTTLIKALSEFNQEPKKGENDVETPDVLWKIHEELGKLPNGAKTLLNLPQKNSYVSFKDFMDFVKRNGINFSDREAKELFLVFNNQHWLCAPQVIKKCESLSERGGFGRTGTNFKGSKLLSSLTPVIKEEITRSYQSDIGRFFDRFSYGGVMEKRDFDGMVDALRLNLRDEQAKTQAFNEFPKDKTGRVDFESFVKGIHLDLGSSEQTIREVASFVAQKGSTIEAELFNAATRARSQYQRGFQVDYKTIKTFFTEELRENFESPSIQKLLDSLRKGDFYHVEPIHHFAILARRLPQSFNHGQRETRHPGGPPVPEPIFQIEEMAGGDQSIGRMGGVPPSHDMGGPPQQASSNGWPQTSFNNEEIKKIFDQVVIAMKEDKLTIQMMRNKMDPRRTGFCPVSAFQMELLSTLGFEESVHTKKLENYLKDPSGTRIDMGRLEQSLIASGMPRADPIPSSSNSRGDSRQPGLPNQRGDQRTNSMGAAPLPKPIQEMSPGMKQSIENAKKNISTMRNFFKNTKRMENKAIFDFYDKRKNGFFTKDTFVLESQRLNIPGLTPKNFEEIFALLDTNKNNKVKVPEFRLFFYNEAVPMEVGVSLQSEIKREIQEIFRKTDTNNNGFIDKEELKGLFIRMGMTPDPEEIEKYMKDIDLDGDGRLSENEFVMVLEDKYKKEVVRTDELVSKLMYSFSISPPFQKGGRTSFKKVDVYETRQLNAYQLRQVLKNIGINMHEEHIFSIFNEIDSNKNGVIDIEELLDFLQQPEQDFANPLALEAVTNIKMANFLTPRALFEIFEKVPESFSRSFMAKQLQKGKSLPSAPLVPKHSRTGFAYQGIVLNTTNPMVAGPLMPLPAPKVLVEITIGLAKGVPVIPKAKNNNLEVLARQLNVCLYNMRTGKPIGGTVIIPGATTSSKGDEWSFKYDPYAIESSQVLLRLDQFDKAKDQGLKLLFEMVIFIQESESLIQVSPGWAAVDISALIENQKLSLALEGGEPRVSRKINTNTAPQAKGFFGGTKTISSQIEISINKSIADASIKSNVNYLPPDILFHKPSLNLLVAYRFYIAGQLIGLSKTASKDLMSNTIVLSFLKMLNSPILSRKFASFWTKSIMPKISKKDSVKETIAFFEAAIEKIYFLLNCSEFCFVESDQTFEHYNSPETQKKREKMMNDSFQNIMTDLPIPGKKPGLPVITGELSRSKPFEISELIEGENMSLSEKEFFSALKLMTN